MQANLLTYTQIALKHCKILVVDSQGLYVREYLVHLRENVTPNMPSGAPPYS